MSFEHNTYVRHGKVNHEVLPYPGNSRVRAMNLFFHCLHCFPFCLKSEHRLVSLYLKKQGGRLD